jgi:hypothetical protein
MWFWLVYSQNSHAMKVNHRSIFLLLVLVGCCAVGFAQSPVLITATVNGEEIKMGSAQKVSTQSTVRITVSNVGGEEYKVQAKAIQYGFAGQLGASKQVFSFPMTRQEDGSYAGGVTPPSPAGTKLQMEVVGIKVLKNGKPFKVSIPLNQRSLLIESI